MYISAALHERYFQPCTYCAQGFFNALFKNSSSDLIGNQQSVDQNRIIGGSVTEAGSWPSQVAIYTLENGDFTFICGGSVLNSTFVLTAAHCCFEEGGTHGSLMYILAGVHDLTMPDHYWQERTVIRAITHPDFDRMSKYWSSDIAILELESPLEFSERVKPALLPQRGQELTLASWATVIGWGRGEPGVKTKALREAQIQISIPELCPTEQNHHKLICAGGLNAGTCRGDSGGPLMVKEDDEQWYLFGITAYGVDPCGIGFGSVYTKVAFFIDWIEHILQTS